MINGNIDDNYTISISEKSRAVVAKMKEHNLLSIGKGDNDVNTKDIYLLAMALGLDKEPTSSIKGGESYTRTIYFKDFDRALLVSALLENANSTEDLLEFCDIKKAFSNSKGFTDAGFEVIDELAQNAMYDPELMVKKLLEYVEDLYDETIKR